MKQRNLMFLSYQISHVWSYYSQTGEPVISDFEEDESSDDDDDEEEQGEESADDDEEEIINNFARNLNFDNDNNMFPNKKKKSKTGGHCSSRVYARSFLNIEGREFVEVGFLCSSGMRDPDRIIINFISDTQIEVQEPIDGRWLDFCHVPDWTYSEHRLVKVNGVNGDEGVFNQMLRNRFPNPNDQNTMIDTTTIALPCPCHKSITNRAFHQHPATHVSTYTMVFEAKTKRRTFDANVEGNHQGFGGMGGGGLNQGGWQGAGAPQGPMPAGGAPYAQGHQHGGFAGQPGYNQGGVGAGNPNPQANMGFNAAQGVPYTNRPFHHQQPYPQPNPPHQHYAPQPPAAPTHFQQQQHQPTFRTPPPQNPFPPQQPANYHQQYQQPAAANPTTTNQQQQQPTPTTTYQQQQQQATNPPTQQHDQYPNFASPPPQQAARHTNATPNHQQAPPSPFLHNQQPAIPVTYPDQATPGAYAFSPHAPAATTMPIQPPITNGTKIAAAPSNVTMQGKRVSNRVCVFCKPIYNNYQFITITTLSE